MDVSVLTLSRFQFALTIMFHYLFPPLSIGLGGLLVIMAIIAAIAACGMPFVLAYTSVVYWVFRGKVQLGKFSY